MSHAKSPKPPFVCMGFYFHALNSADAFVRVYNQLLAQGGKLAGTIPVKQDDNIREKLPQHVRQMTIDTDHLTAAEFEQVADNPDVYPLGAGLVDASGTKQGVLEKLRYVPAYDGDNPIDNRPIELQIDGAVFGVPRESMNAAQKQQADTTWSAIEQTFQDVAEATEPDYAAIAIEDYLAAPVDFVTNNHMEYTFYVAQHWLQPADEAIIAGLAESTGIQLCTLQTGLYIHCTGRINNTPQAETLRTWQTDVISRIASESKSRYWQAKWLTSS